MIDIPFPPVVLMDGNPLLRTVSQPLDPDDYGEQAEILIEVMLAVVCQRKARGLAAIQIGVPLRVIVMVADGQELAMVNPVMTRSLNRFTVEQEGCLSVLPQHWRKVSRPAKCDVTWLGPNGIEYQATLTGDAARIFQHELDHLDGVLLTDKPPA